MAGKIDYKVDKNGCVAAPVGKASFDEAKLVENASSLIESLVKSKPASAKGDYIQSATLASSMSPGIALGAISLRNQPVIPRNKRL